MRTGKMLAPAERRTVMEMDFDGIADAIRDAAVTTGRRRALSGLIAGVAASLTVKPGSQARKRKKKRNP
jgi:hypothetical protein